MEKRFTYSTTEDQFTRESYFDKNVPLFSTPEEAYLGAMESGVFSEGDIIFIMEEIPMSLLPFVYRAQDTLQFTERSLMDMWPEQFARDYELRSILSDQKGVDALWEKVAQSYIVWSLNNGLHYLLQKYGVFTCVATYVVHAGKPQKIADVQGSSDLVQTKL